MDALTWLYLSNATLLICHEIDSAYWKEWDFFAGLAGKPPAPDGDLKGLTGFLVFHVPVVFVVLYGLLALQQEAATGPYFSLAVCGAGLFAFSIHMYGFKRSRPEFRAPISIVILAALLPVSIAQFILTVQRFR